MEHDPDRRRFFAYLNLFIASMLLLVLANSYLLLFVGWEGVGLASYLLIGFWNWNPAYATAANKAFFVNRVGDLGLVIAIMLMFVTFGGVDYKTVSDGVANANQGALTAMGLLLLVGACGKSAQFPLQSWLGDAMAGPTPVSALIHAATMVTAGVYLVVRSDFIYDGTPDARLAVATVGAITLIFGAISRLRQGRHQEGPGGLHDEPDRVHDAGRRARPGRLRLRDLPPAHPRLLQGRAVPRRRSVMHGMRDRVNMRHYGALALVMKITWVTFGLAGWRSSASRRSRGSGPRTRSSSPRSSATAGTPWVFGGVADARCRHHGLLHVAPVLHDLPRREALGATTSDPHESPLAHDVPMMVLARGLGLPRLALGPTGVITPGSRRSSASRPRTTRCCPRWSSILTLLLVAAPALAWLPLLARRRARGGAHGQPLTRAARVDLYQDAVNEALFMRPGIHLTRVLVFADARGVDGAVGGLAAWSAGFSSRLRRSRPASPGRMP
jgi:NADH-quinone oxidoreductase subunit L